MKKLLLLLLLFTGMANAQIVNIPDPYFKAVLLSHTPVIDTNGDGEIQVSEALALNYMYIPNGSNNIVSLQGINSFSNLLTLNFTGNQIASVDISGLVNLKELFCEYNLLTSLDVSSCTNLENIQCAYNQLTSLNVTGLTHLKHISCYINSITSLNVAGMSTLETLDIRNNQISSIDLSGLTSLQIINCNTNQLTSIDLTQSPNLQQLACATNNFTSLNLTPYTNLTYLAVGNVGLTSIDVSNMVNLTTFLFYGSQQTTMDLSALTNLTSFQCRNSNLNSIDVSNSPNLFYILLYMNQNLNFLNIKNGNTQLSAPNNFFMTNHPNINFVCADDYNINLMNFWLTSPGYLNNATAVLNSYCSFTPGGNYNTVTGTTRIDTNNNGCDNSDFKVPFFRMNVSLNGVGTLGSVFTNELGVYNLYTSYPGTFQLDPVLENPTYFIYSPITATIATIDNSITTQDMCLTPNGVHPDLEVVIEPVTPARPGFDAVYKIVYRNKGNTTPSFNSGVHLEYNPNQMAFVSASQALGTQGSNYINFDYSNLMPLETRSITVIFHINTPTDTNPVSIGDVLAFHGNIGLNIGDEHIADNDFYYNQTVVGAFDPNSIECLEGPIVSPSQIGNYLHYSINFENTGNYQAENVVVRDIIDITKYDINSLQVMNTSHASYTRLNANVIEFVFENVNLAAASGNPPVGGHGNILFKIKSKDDLVANDFVSKRANIYFDYNAPIDTNFAQTTFQLLNNSIFESDASVVIYPNPTYGMLNIKSDFTIRSIELYDVQGRLLQTNLENATTSEMDITARQTGIYFVKVNTEKGGKVEKIIRE